MGVRRGTALPQRRQGHDLGTFLDGTGGYHRTLSQRVRLFPTFFSLMSGYLIQELYGMITVPPTHRNTFSTIFFHYTRDGSKRGRFRACFNEMVRPPGLEPGSLAWKANILPLYHERSETQRMWNRIKGFTPRGPLSRSSMSQGCPRR